MDRKRGIINIFIGSVLGAAFMTLLVGYAMIDPYPNDLVTYVGVTAITLTSSFLIQKTIQKEFPFLVFLSGIGLSVLALYFSFGLQVREWGRLFILALATLTLFILNLVIFMIRSKLRKKAEQGKKQPVSKTNLLYPAVLSAIIFIGPIFLTVYINSFMPPLVEPGGSVKYDQIWQRGVESKNGLLLTFWAIPRGNVDDFHWVTSAYLISREWTNNPEETWKSGSYVRRAKFYNDKVESFDRNIAGDFERETYSSDFFLPYSVIEEGRSQGDFPNYRPESLRSIITGSDRIQFGVETITVVSKSKDKFAREGVYGKVRRDIFLLNEYAGHAYAEDNYPTSRWLAMVSAEGTYQSGIEQLAQNMGESKDFSDNSKAPSSIEVEAGKISWDKEKGIVVFKEKEVEIKPGILFSRSTALIRNDPENEQLGHRGLTMLKFTNTTGNEQQFEFIEEIPKTLAQHVNQLQFKILDGSPESSISDFVDDIDGFVGISDFVNTGHARVIEEDPSIAFIVAVSALLGGSYTVVYKPHWIGVQPLMNESKWNGMIEEQKLKWINTRLNQYCDVIRKSAKANNIPPRLLAAVVLNELADYDVADQVEEILFVGANHSSGWAQLQPNRIIDHGLIDIGLPNEIRDPTVDINKDDVKISTFPSYPRGTSPPIRTSNRDMLIYSRLVKPEAAFELAAREIVYLLNMLKKGSPYTKNPWAQSLLNNPEEGIDLDNIYANLKMEPRPVDNRLDATQEARRKQIELEKTLAILVVSGYNGSGAIYGVADKNAIFPFHENPWAPGNKYTPEGKLRGLYQPTVHAVNAAQELTERIFESSCLKESPPPIRQYRDITAKDILVKPEEIGPGFVSFHDMGTLRNRADVQFKHWDNGIDVSVHLMKKVNKAAHDREKNDYVIMTRQKMSDSRYVVEKLSLGDYSYIIKMEKASFETHSYPGEMWHLHVGGSYYSFSGDYAENAPLVKRAVIKAISAMHHRVIELESR